jgi:hypothetical protein
MNVCACVNTHEKTGNEYNGIRSMGMLNRHEYMGLVLKGLKASVCISHMINAGMNGKVMYLTKLYFLYFTCSDNPNSKPKQISAEQL